MANPNVFLSAPIPGQSLTVEPGSVPWENPPEYAKLEDVVKYYTNKLDDQNSSWMFWKLLRETFQF